MGHKYSDVKGSNAGANTAVLIRAARNFNHLK